MHLNERVVLLNEAGQPKGSALKSEVHNSDTALHLAFSCYLFNADGEVLLTRRALSKKTWPGVWTNSFCGHPAPDEEMNEAIIRRAREELGTEVTEIAPAIPEFRYRAVDASGVVENEVCPVYVARITGDLDLNPEEVAESAWVPLAEIATVAAQTPFLLSPWSVLQIPALVDAHRFSPGT